MKEKLDSLILRKQELDRKIKKIKEKKDQKKKRDETRRKIIVGGVVLSMLKSGEMPLERINALLDKHVKNKKDREFLGLR